MTKGKDSNVDDLMMMYAGQNDEELASSTASSYYEDGLNDGGEGQEQARQRPKRLSHASLGAADDGSDDDASYDSSGSFGTTNSSTKDGGGGAKDERFIETATETKLVNRSKKIVYMILFLAAAAISTLCYIFLVKEEETTMKVEVRMDGCFYVSHLESLQLFGINPLSAARSHCSLDAYSHCQLLHNVPSPFVSSKHTQLKF